MGSDIEDWINTLESHGIEYELNTEEPSILTNIKNIIVSILFLVSAEII